MAQNDLQWGLRSARKLRLRIVQPKPNQLQIDLDGARAVRRYGLLYRIFQRAGLTTGWKETLTNSRRANHVHITITMPSKINNATRVAWESLLGSDPLREAFNWCRVCKRNKFPIVFFERENKRKNHGSGANMKN